MRRNIFTYLVSCLLFLGCIPLDYIEPVGIKQGDYSRENTSRDFYHQSMTRPIIVEYENGTSKGKILYEIDDPYVDIEMINSRPRINGMPDGYYSLEDINDCFKFYITAQKAVVDDDLDLANKSIDKALDLIEIKPFYDLKGSIFYLSGDTVKANYYWNYLNIE